MKSKILHFAFSLSHVPHQIWPLFPALYSILCIFKSMQLQYVKYIRSHYHAFYSVFCFCFNLHLKSFSCQEQGVCVLSLSVHGISRQEHLCRLPFPPLGDLPGPGIASMSLVPLALAGWQVDSSHWVTWEAQQVFLFPYDDCRVFQSLWL